MRPGQVIASVIAQSLMEKVIADIWMQEGVHLPVLWLGKLLRLLLLPTTPHVVLCIDPTSQKGSDHMHSRNNAGKPNILLWQPVALINHIISMSRISALYINSKTVARAPLAFHQRH